MDRRLPGAAETDREGTSCVNDASNYHHHHGPSKEKVTFSGQHRFSLLPKVIDDVSKSVSILHVFNPNICVETIGPIGAFFFFFF